MAKIFGPPDRSADSTWGYGWPLSLFLAGGISNCDDWHSSILEMLADANILIFNPRRKEMASDEASAREQIRWEHNYLRSVDAISFWFPKESVCPITLFELGFWISKLDRKIMVGCDPGYSRKLDLEEQISLVRSDIKIVYSLSDLAQQILSWSA